MSSFVHLHLHSQYSLLDGANRIGDVLDEAASLGMPAMAITDHGNMFGAIEFYNRARRAGVKPILGVEAYVAQGDHRDRDPGRASSNHLVLLARNETGYRNLLKLTTRSYLEGFYYKPRIDKELLRQNAEGLLGMSACLKGEINEQIVGRRQADAEATARDFREILGDGNFYLEMQDHGIPEQRQANEVLRSLSKKTGIPLVVSNDAHYLRRDDAFAHDVLLCIGTQRMLADADRMRYASEEFYVKSAEEMHRVFPADGAAIENTLAIAERCNLEISTGSFHLPRFPVPAGSSLDSYLADVAREGLEQRLEGVRRRRAAGDHRLPDDEVYRRRLEVELEIIQNMGFSGYFLIVWDFIRYAREQSIPVGPGRGSAAGSLVSFSLRITDIDPLRYDLLFERFLNPERISMPDIDIDFCMRRRGEVIHYVSEKYGRDKVAQIITFGTLAAKAVIRDVGRVLGLPYAKADRIAKLVPDMTRSLEEAAKEIDALATEVKRDPEVRQIVEVGGRLEGLTRHASMHAAGVVIAPCPIEELVPLCKTSKDEVLTQWDKDVIEELGLLKMDFLGLRTLTVIDDALSSLRLQGIELDLDAVPLDDAEVYRLFCEGRTNGIFQFESGGMKDLLRRAQPSKFEDLAAFNALYRPGALSVGMVEEYIRRKQGKKVKYILPETQPILEETYGVIAYQEQVMQIAVEVAGFTMGEADVLRKAMGKKKLEVMAEQKQKFVDGAERLGKSRRSAAELWEYIEPFAGYGFNKSHSVAYAMLAYKTAYLKAHYPVAFMAAMLSSEMGSKDNVAKYMQECREMGIAVLPPDVNISNWSFTAVGDTIRFGLGAVKGIGESAVEAILAARRRVGRFESLAGFCREVDLRAVNRKAFESLIKAGALDAFAGHRAALWECLDGVLDYAQQRRRDLEEGQGMLFAAASLGEPGPDDGAPEWSKQAVLQGEKEALGLYLTGNPLEEIGAQLAGRVTHHTGQLRDLDEQGEVKVRIAGVVARPKRVKIKSGANAGRLMGRFVLEDLHGSVAVTVFADALQKFGGLLSEDSVILVHGAARPRGGEVEISLERAESLGHLSGPAAERLEIRIDREVPPSALLELRDLLVEHPGEVPVAITLASGAERVRISPAERFQVSAGDDLLAAIDALIAPGTALRHCHGGQDLEVGVAIGSEEPAPLDDPDVDLLFD